MYEQPLHLLVHLSLKSNYYKEIPLLGGQGEYLPLNGGQSPAQG